MGQSPDTHLFYGYVWDGETSLKALLHPDNEWDEEEEDDSDVWQNVLLVRRGFINPWETYPDRATLIEMGRTATDEQYGRAISEYRIYNPSRYDDRTSKSVGGFLYHNSPEFQALYKTWEDAQAALKDEFSCDLSSYGSYDVTTAYLYITDGDGEKRSLKSSWDEPTSVDLAALADLYSPTWDDSLRNFIEALALPMDGGEYNKPPAGPGWFMVTSYG